MAERAVPSIFARGLAPPEIRCLVEELLEAGHKVIAVDFAGAPALDGETVDELVRLQRRSDELGIRLLLRNLAGATSEAVTW